MHHSVSANFQ